MLEVTNRITAKYAALFDGWDETLVWSALEGMMGRAFADCLDMPKAGEIVQGDFTFFAGVADQELVLHKPESRNSRFMILVPSSKEWEELIEATYQDRAKKVTRYAIKKEKDIFNHSHLEHIAEELPEGISLQRIDSELFAYAKSNDWTRDWCSQFPSYEQFERLGGIGIVAIKDGVPVSGASSYTVYKDGIEIEVDTMEAYRKQGLASACSAKLILECLKMGKYPSWDAQNKWSVGLAEKLGYHFSHEYTAYEVWGFGEKSMSSN